MHAAESAGPSNRAAVTVLALTTLGLGVAYAALGSDLIWGGATWAARAGGNPWGPVASHFGLGPILVVAVGVAFLPLGLLGLLAGTGALLRKPWGRTLTFLLAVLAILLGLAWVAGGDLGATDLVLGVAQFLYGILAIIILIKDGSTVSARRAGGVVARGPGGGLAEP